MALASLVWLVLLSPRFPPTGGIPRRRPSHHSGGRRATQTRLRVKPKMKTSCFDGGWAALGFGEAETGADQGHRASGRGTRRSIWPREETPPAPPGTRATPSSRPRPDAKRAVGRGPPARPRGPAATRSGCDARRPTASPEPPRCSAPAIRWPASRRPQLAPTSKPAFASSASQVAAAALGSQRDASGGPLPGRRGRLEAQARKQPRVVAAVAPRVGAAASSFCNALRRPTLPWCNGVVKSARPRDGGAGRRRISVCLDASFVVGFSWYE
jgi:hypothetical protein